MRRLIIVSRYSEKSMPRRREVSRQCCRVSPGPAAGGLFLRHARSIHNIRVPADSYQFGGNALRRQNEIHTAGAHGGMRHGGELRGGSVLRKRHPPAALIASRPAEPSEPLPERITPMAGFRNRQPRIAGNGQWAYAIPAFAAAAPASEFHWRWSARRLRVLRIHGWLPRGVRIKIIDFEVIEDIAALGWNLPATHRDATHRRLIAHGPGDLIHTVNSLLHEAVAAEPREVVPIPHLPFHIASFLPAEYFPEASASPDCVEVA